MGSDLSPSQKIAVVGDVHLHWGEEDVAYFNASDYEWLLFVGDIGAYRHSETLKVARSIGQLRKPTILIAGNHDGPSLGQMASEILGKGRLSDRLGARQAKRVDALTRSFGAVEVAGYSAHSLGDDLALVVGRPHSMGGPRVHFADALRRRYGVSSMEESAQRLREVIDGVAESRLIVLAHNGPTGLGDSRSDIWGCDFRKEEGDQGDPDLAAALDHARAQGRRIEAVVAGHMHRRLRGGGERTWQTEQEGCLYVNAAWVPRVFEEDRRTLRHHVELLITPDTVVARDVFVDSTGSELGGR